MEALAVGFVRVARAFLVAVAIAAAGIVAVGAVFRAIRSLPPERRARVLCVNTQLGELDVAIDEVARGRVPAQGSIEVVLPPGRHRLTAGINGFFARGAEFSLPREENVRAVVQFGAAPRRLVVAKRTSVDEVRSLAEITTDFALLPVGTDTSGLDARLAPGTTQVCSASTRHHLCSP